MSAGRLDGVVSTIDTMVLYLTTGKEFQYALALEDPAGGDGIVARKEIKSVKDLKGKKVAGSELQGQFSPKDLVNHSFVK